MATKTFNVDLYQSHIARSHTETFQVQAETEGEAKLAAQEIVDAKDPAIEGDYDFEVKEVAEPLPPEEAAAAQEHPNGGIMEQPLDATPAEQPAERLNSDQLAEKQREDSGQARTVTAPADENRDDLGKGASTNPDGSVNEPTNDVTDL